MRLNLLTIALAAITVTAQIDHSGHNHGVAIKSLLSKIKNRPLPTKTAAVLPSSKETEGVFTILPVQEPTSTVDPHAGHDMTILPVLGPTLTSDPHAGHGSMTAAPVASVSATSAPGHGDGHGGHATPSGAVTEPETTIPEGFFIEPDLDPKKPSTPGSRIIEQKFGPYKLTAGQAKNFFASAKMPCTNCWITAAQGVLEYADGTEANIDTGAWLHHMVMLQRAASGTPDSGRFECKSGILGNVNLPVRIFWSTGNERVVQRTNADGKFAHKVTGSTSASMTFELMNESKKTQEYYMKFRYEVLDISQPEAAGYKQTLGIWMDIGGCTGSDVPAQQGKYQIESPVFRVAHGGRLLDTAAHLHDGGTHMEVLQNGKVICSTGVLYGRKPETREPAGEGHGMLHISDAHVCRDFGTVKKGDELKVIAYYDANKYPQMVHDGKLHPIMGIAVIAMAPDPEI